MVARLVLFAVASTAMAKHVRRLADVQLWNSKNVDWGGHFVGRMRQCASRNEGWVIMAVENDAGDDVYELTTCDDFLQAILLFCAHSGRPVDAAGVECGRGWLEFALANDKFRGGLAERARRVLGAMDDTAEFNGLVDQGAAGLRFADDFVTSNWALAWLVDELVAPAGFAPQRALEIGSYEGRSAWLWYRLLPPGSTLTCVDLRFAPNFHHNARPLAENGFLERALDGRPSKVALFDLDPAEPFDLIYVDGSHNKSHVLADLVLADALLRIGGLLVVDDFEWLGVNDAAHAFFYINADDYDVVSVYRQLALRKRKEADVLEYGDGARYQDSEVRSAPPETPRWRDEAPRGPRP